MNWSERAWPLALPPWHLAPLNGQVSSGSQPRLLQQEPRLRRIALCLQYDGSCFNGWQRQSQAPSVQARLEAAIAELDPQRP